MTRPRFFLLALFCAACLIATPADSTAFTTVCSGTVAQDGDNDGVLVATDCNACLQAAVGLATPGFNAPLTLCASNTDCVTQDQRGPAAESCFDFECDCGGSTTSTTLPDACDDKADCIQGCLYECTHPSDDGDSDSDSHSKTYSDCRPGCNGNGCCGKPAPGRCLSDCLKSRCLDYR